MSVNIKYEQENYIIKKLKQIRSKLYQAYLIPFFVDFGFRIGGALLGELVGAKSATIIGIVLLTLTRIKAVKDLYDVVKGLIETEKLSDPTLTTKRMLSRDIKKIINTIFSKSKINKEKQETNSMSIILGAIAPMLFDYFSMGIVAKYGATGALVTQIIDTLLHLSALLVLYSSIKNVNKKLQKFNEEYYSKFKAFVSESLPLDSKNIFYKLTMKNKLKDVLNKEKTNQNSEKIRRFLVSSENANSAIKKSVDSKEWTQFYLHFPSEADKAERSVRKSDNKYMIVTKIFDQTNLNNEYGCHDTSRDTYTVEINESRYNEFFSLNGKAPIYELTCYSIPFDKGVILLDVYKNLYNGLNIARVKFDSDEASSLFKVPNWFGREITNDPEYSGKHFPFTKNK